MKLVLFTSDQIRHRYFVNQLAPMADEFLIFMKSKPEIFPSNRVTRHYFDQAKEEMRVFGDPEFLPWTDDLSRLDDFKPDLGIVFGYSVIPQIIIDLFPEGRLINLHLGLSPWYRGCGTNFWPWVDDRLDLLGTTIHIVDRGIDTGLIISQMTPYFKFDDNVHTVGCRLIQESIAKLQGIIVNGIEDDCWLKKQIFSDTDRICKRADFNDEAILKYQENLKNGIVKKYL